MSILDRFRSKPKPHQKRSTPQFIGSAERLKNSWYRNLVGNPNSTVRDSLTESRKLSRVLCQTDVYAARWLELMSVYVIGHQGFQFNPHVTNKDGSLNDTINNELKRGWLEWTNFAAQDGKSTFLDIEQTIIRQLARDGEILVKIVVDTQVNKAGFALQILDPALLDNEFNGMNGSNTIMNGIEYEPKYERAVAYYVWSGYMDDTMKVNRTRQRIPADEIIHIYDDEYGTRRRGLPWLSPAIYQLARLHEFMDANLLACQVAAAAPLVLSSQQDDYADFNQDDNVTNVKDTTDGSTTQNSGAQQQFINLDYTQILELSSGQQLSALDIKFPNNQFGDVVKSYLRGIASALNMSYTALTSDSSDENYASGRLGSIYERDHWQQIQFWLIRRFHQEVYRRWIQVVINRNFITLPSSNGSDYFEVHWIPRGFRWVDPVKDANAYVTLLKEGIMTRTEITAERGGDWRNNIQILEQEQQFAVDHNVSLGEQPKTITQQVAVLEQGATTNG